MIIFAALKSRADQITIFELSQAIEQKKKKKVLSNSGWVGWYFSVISELSK